jgi:hypothetical protein
MRVAGLPLWAGVLATVVGCCFPLLAKTVLLSRTSPWEYVSVVGLVAAAVVVFSISLPIPQRSRNCGKLPSRESLPRLCGVGALAWVLVLLLFLGEYVVPNVALSGAVVTATRVIVR